MLNSSTGICFIAWFVVAGCDGSPGSVAGQAADRVFLNGAVYTVDAKRSWAEAVAVNGGLITFVGSTDDVQSWIGENTDVTDLDADQRMDLETMIEAYTINGAYTMSLEDQQGSIEVGKRADFVVLDYNLFDLAPQDISEASVTMTIFDGRTVYQVTE